MTNRTDASSRYRGHLKVKEYVTFRHGRTARPSTHLPFRMPFRLVGSIDRSAEAGGGAFLTFVFRSLSGAVHRDLHLAFLLSTAI
jgi:hypothetical protein